jgi:hypothetical protein
MTEHKRPSERLPQVDIKGISEREMMGFGPSLWSRLKAVLARRRQK